MVHTISPATTTAPPAGTSFVEWGAVFAGGVMAAAISFVLLTFGSAIGLSMTSPWEGSGVSGKTAAMLAVFWTLAQQIGALMVGGYIAGRMRSRWAEANQDEVEFRDGLHGGLVWAVGVVIGAMLVFSTAGAVTKTVANVAGQAASAAAANADPLASQIDALLRPAVPARAATAPAAAPGSTPSTTTPPTTAASAATVQGSSADTRGELSRMLARSVANGSLTEADRGYLASVVAQRTGMSQADAERRVNEVYAEAVRTTKEAADKARRAAVLTGFVTAAGLLISLAAAWWAALQGGHHRDNSIPARFNFAAAARRP